MNKINLFITIIPWVLLVNSFSMHEKEPHYNSEEFWFTNLRKLIIQELQKRPVCGGVVHELLVKRDEELWIKFKKIYNNIQACPQLNVLNKERFRIYYENLRRIKDQKLPWITFTFKYK